MKSGARCDWERGELLAEPPTVERGAASCEFAARARRPLCAHCERARPNQVVFSKIERIIRLMQDEQVGLPVKTAKSFMSKVPSVFTGSDLIQWMMRNLRLDDQQEATHLASLIAAHGYIFPIEDHTPSIKNDATFYRFQAPCLWPSHMGEPENTDYAVYLCKRSLQGKARLELADYEAENLARLQKTFARKWNLIASQAESQAKVDKRRDKLERKVLDSQERAFWDVHRPVPGCVNTTELDIRKACRLSRSTSCAECQKLAASARDACQLEAAALELRDGGPAGGGEQENRERRGTPEEAGCTEAEWKGSEELELDWDAEGERRRHHERHHAQREATGEHRRGQRPPVVVREPLISMPAESICTTTLAAGVAWAPLQLEPRPEGGRKSSASLVEQLQQQRLELACSARRKSDSQRAPPSAASSPREAALGPLAPNLSDSNLLAAPDKEEEAEAARPNSACSFQNLREPQPTRKSSLGAELRPQSACGVGGRKGSALVARSLLKETRSVGVGLALGRSTGALSTQAASADELEGLERELRALRLRFGRRLGEPELNKVAASYVAYFKQWADYDPFVVQPIPSNPWLADSSELWDSERQTKDVHCRRVRRWAFSLKELLSDPAGRQQFRRFLEKEFSAENLNFWEAVRELKQVRSRDVASRVEAIWNEYLARDANCPINIDSKSYESSRQNMAQNRNNRSIFDQAAGHVYQLMKNDSYPRYLRSELYKDYKEASERKRNNQTFDVFKPQITTLKHKFNF